MKFEQQNLGGYFVQKYIYEKLKLKENNTACRDFMGILIVFVWSQYDDANIEQLRIGYGWRQNQWAKLKNVGVAIS